MKNILRYLLVIYAVLLMAMTESNTPLHTAPTKLTLTYFADNSVVFANQCKLLKQAIERLDRKKKSLLNAREALKQCRLSYKRITFFMNHFLASPALLYNEPPNPEVEVPFMETTDPAGLQLIEALLFEKEVLANKKELLEQANLMDVSASDLHALLYNLEIDDKAILESLRLSLIYSMTLEITGFDAPELKSGLEEAKVSVETIREVLLPYFEAYPNVEHRALLNHLNKAVEVLGSSKSFDDFDRLHYTRDIALPIQRQLAIFVREAQLSSPAMGMTNAEKTLFEADALALPLQESKMLISLGEQLYHEKALSGNLERSCASCHAKENYFADGLSKNTTLDQQGKLPRNTPTLLYAAYQHSQFWDGRSPNFQALIMEVLQNPQEMGANLDQVTVRLNQMEVYKKSFALAFPENKNGTISINQVTHSIAAYLGSLSPFNSPFDRYMAGEDDALDVNEKKGYNLFMGKAQCGSCHFAPIFNGTVPPKYDRTDLEVLGITSNDHFASPQLDEDHGRYATYAMPTYLGAFKTPTVRNVAKTAPYMHNGNFATLEAVVEFYNKGGGAGMGLDVPVQTLSAKPLFLSKKEVKDIVAFLNSLTDNIK